MSYMFYNCKKLTKLDLSNFKTGNLKNVSCMFSSCGKLEILDLSNFDISQVPNKLANTMSMFTLVPSTIEIYVKNEETKQFILKRNSKLNVIIK